MYESIEPQLKGPISSPSDHYIEKSQGTFQRFQDGGSISQPSPETTARQPPRLEYSGKYLKLPKNSNEYNKIEKSKSRDCKRKQSNYTCNNLCQSSQNHKNNTGKEKHSFNTNITVSFCFLPSDESNSKKHISKDMEKCELNSNRSSIAYYRLSQKLTTKCDNICTNEQKDTADLNHREHTTPHKQTATMKYNVSSAVGSCKETIVHESITKADNSRLLPPRLIFTRWPSQVHFSRWRSLFYHPTVQLNKWLPLLTVLLALGATAQQVRM